MAMRFVVIFSCDLEVVEVPFEQIRLQGRFATFDSHNDWIGFAQSDDHETERIRCSAIYGDAFYEATVILVSLDDGYDLTRVIQYCRRCRLEKDFRPKRMFLQVSPRVICPGVKKRLLLKPVQALQSDHGTMDSEADVGSGQPAASASHPHGASVVPKPSMEAAQLLPMQNRASPSAAAASPSDLHRSVRGLNMTRVLLLLLLLSAELKQVQLENSQADGAKFTWRRPLWRRKLGVHSNGVSAVVNATNRSRRGDHFFPTGFWSINIPLTIMAVYDSLEDLTELCGPFTDDVVVKTLQQRYSSGKRFTSIGPTLISANTNSSSHGIRALVDTGTHEPAVQRLAETLLLQLKDSGLNQCLLLHGISGSGKTFLLQQLLRCLFSASSSLQTDSFKHCSAALTILQPLTVAGTADNPDSSR
uniref:AAA_16 domain-containing protein n=1 Tax=Macrostomum lignano TaxID=282301 RepID=A0A1I8ILT4_9PLAT